MKIGPPWVRSGEPWLRLCKIRVSLLAAFSALTGCVLASPRLTGALLIPPAGVFILACGAGALNQWQEREIDAGMSRTRQRPLPASRIRPLPALGLSALLMGLGLSILAAGGRTAVLLGLFAVLWYNGVYTYLKKRSAFAAVPGALTGAIPPAIGWVCAGGLVSDARLSMLGLFFFMWQVPHFWLVALERADEYRTAGLRTLADFLSTRQIERIVAHWILATAACSLLIALGGIPRAPVGQIGVLGVSLWLAYEAVRFRMEKGKTGRALFRKLSFFVVFILVILCVERLVA